MLVWAHGLWGSPNGSKITTIRESGIEAISPDFNEMELVDRVELIEKTITQKFEDIVSNDINTVKRH